MRKIILFTLVCVILLTGCGMPDKAADRMAEIDTGMVNTTDEIEEALNQADKNKATSEMVLSTDTQQKLLELKQFLIKEEKEEIIKIENYESDLDGWINAKSADDSVFDESEIMLGWEVSVVKSENLLNLLDGLEKLGYTGLRDRYEKSKNSGLPETLKYVPFVKHGVSFYISDDGGDDMSFDMSIDVYKANICYPKQLEHWISDSIYDSFYITNVFTEGYLQSIVLSVSPSPGDGAYNKQCVLYLKDGKLFQMDISVQESGWQEEVSDEEDNENTTYKFFADSEKTTMKNLLADMGVSEDASAQFLDEISPGSESNGSVGNLNWYLQEEGKTDDTLNNWTLRIQ